MAVSSVSDRLQGLANSGYDKTCSFVKTYLGGCVDLTRDNTFYLLDLVKAFEANVKVCTYFTGVSLPKSLQSGFKEFAALPYAVKGLSGLINDLVYEKCIFTFVRDGKCKTIDWSKSWIKFGGIFEVDYYLRSHDVYNTPAFLSSLSSRLGGVRLFELNRKDYSIGNTPVVEMIVNSPNLFCYVVGSAISIKTATIKYLKGDKTFYNLFCATVVESGSLCRELTLVVGRYCVSDAKNNLAYLLAEATLRNAKYLNDIWKIQKEIDNKNDSLV